MPKIKVWGKNIWGTLNKQPGCNFSKQLVQTENWNVMNNVRVG